MESLNQNIFNVNIYVFVHKFQIIYLENYTEKVTHIPTHNIETAALLKKLN